MADERPRNWDWVKATHECSALIMFGELKALAQRDVQARNQQLNQERFTVTEINGIQFAVGRAHSMGSRIYFRVTDDLKQVEVTRHEGAVIGRYTVGLDENGTCRFRQEAEQLDPWQVLKAMLEPLLFG
jgi:hypothetical protein